MAVSVLSAEHFHDEEAAFAFVEARLWPNGPSCPFCCCVDRIKPLHGQTTRIGLRKCYACRKNFTVRHGTIFQASHLELHLWLQAIHLLCASKKGISSNQLHRILGCTLKTAWFLSHRIRGAMIAGDLGPLGGEGEFVEADETYIGKKEGRERAKGGHAHKRVVMALVQRGGSVRSFHVSAGDGVTATQVVLKNVAAKTTLMTDQTKIYDQIGALMGSHQTVNHSIDEYVRGNVHTQTIDGFFSIFKRGMNGVYQHCAEKHLQRYLTEFDFRYNNRIRLGVNDNLRVERALQGVVGKRLTYRTTKRELATLAY